MRQWSVYIDKSAIKWDARAQQSYWHIIFREDITTLKELKIVDDLLLSGWGEIYLLVINYIFMKLTNGKNKGQTQNFKLAITRHWWR